MSSLLRSFCFAAFLFAGFTARAANPVPGLEVIALRGSAVVFRAVTDGRGRFETGPLEPGIYTIEVRTVPNTPPTSARFFLSLAGATPLGEAMIRPGVAVAMSAKVRNPAGIRGQLTARGGIVYVPTGTLAPRTVSNPSPSATPAGVRTGTAPSTYAANQVPARAQAVAPSTQPATIPEPSIVGRPSGQPTKIINGRRYSWTPITAGSNLGRWTPDSVSRPVATPAPARKSSSTKPSPTPSRTRL